MSAISIIVPCRNGEKYLPDCIQSIQSQDFQAFELLLIDDHSTDGTREIMNGFAAKDARLRVFGSDTEGVSGARNLGIEKAQGEWILFVDADDLLPPGALGTLFRETLRDRPDMVIAAHETFGDGKQICPFWPESRWYDLPWPERRHAMALRLIEGDSILNIMCNKLHRRSFLQSQGIRLCENVRVAEDALFNLEAVLMSGGAVYCHAVTYRYRMHTQSTMNRASGPELEMHRPWLSAMRAMLERRGMFEQYYGAFLDSVTLRLYKDGGIGGTVRGFGEKAFDLVNPDGLTLARMSGRDRRAAKAVSDGRYARWYPLDAIGQIVRRKAGEASFAVRRAGELRRLKRPEECHE
ncbi:MAG: glycosyltransferase family 2 protein [Clostridia bacterium]|nr:glycosyltransferase family 2 protein [Clostridia bacterium]